MKKIINLSFVIVLVFLYQNCGENSSTGGGSGNEFSEGSGPSAGGGGSGNGSTGGGDGSNFPPLASAGEDQRIVHNGTIGLERVTLNGTASADADGNIVDYTWYEGGAILATGVAPTPILSVGSHRIILTVTDDNGATSSDLVSIIISGTIEPPPTRPVEDFEVTLYPVLRNYCIGCHAANVIPKFASGDVDRAWDAVISKRLADFGNPGASRFVGKIRGGHQGFGNAEANDIQNAIQAWVNP